MADIGAHVSARGFGRAKPFTYSVCGVRDGEFDGRARGERKENERFGVKALDLLSSLSTRLGVSANVKVTSGCGQTAKWTTAAAVWEGHACAGRADGGNQQVSGKGKKCILMQPLKEKDQTSFRLTLFAIGLTSHGGTDWTLAVKKLWFTPNLRRWRQPDEQAEKTFLRRRIVAFLI